MERHSKCTYEDYVDFPEDGKRHEVVDGEHVVNPAPTTEHQMVSGKLFAILYDAVQRPEIGIVFAAPTDVELSPTDIVQPDLVVVLRTNRRLITPTKIKGAPDLVVEILSPSTERMDRGSKRRLYDRSGVSEYWIVDPREHTIEQFTRTAVRKDFELEVCASKTFTSSTLGGCEFDVRTVW